MQFPPAEIISSNPMNYIKVPKKAPTNIKWTIIAQEKLSDLLKKYPFGSPYYIPILNFLTDELLRRKKQQAENEVVAGDSYILPLSDGGESISATVEEFRRA